LESWERGRKLIINISIYKFGEAVCEYEICKRLFLCLRLSPRLKRRLTILFVRHQYLKSVLYLNKGLNWPKFLSKVEIVESHIVPPRTEKARLSDYLPKIFVTISSRKGIKKAIKRGAVFIDGKPAETGRWVIPGQQIQLVELDVKPIQVFEFPFEVIYEDEHIAVINKPGGIEVSGNKFRTIQNALPYNLQYSNEADALKRFLPVHRLDAPTCGLLLVAKSKSARIHLGKQFEKKEIQKRYQGIVIGNIPEKGKIDLAIERKASRTRFEKVRQVESLKNKYLSLVDLFPETGRTHQLRIHLSKFGFPILGDKLYGEDGMILKGKGLFLCAVELTFEHPSTKKNITLKINPPPKFHNFMNGEKRRWDQYQSNLAD
jgi:RluA family pseudouridine synthase